ncbi:MAG: rhodanese-like domain-containing protein [Pseudomonadales bacterium]
MSKTSVSLSIVLLTVFLSCSAISELRQTVKEPSTYRTSDYRSEVPLTVKGATVIDSAQKLQRFLHKNKDSILLDVFPAPHKPDNFPASDLWIEPERETLPGALWLANTGMGNIPEELETLLKKQLKQLTLGDKQRSVVIFCEPACWHSWNAAKRAASYGYSSIYWYRQGVTGWQEAGFPVKVRQPTRP